MILIIGATGRIGSATMQQLVGKGLPVRALLRHPEKAAIMADIGVEPVIGNLEQPHTLEAALDGVSATLLVSPLDPHQVELQGNFIEAAKRAGSVNVVKISGLATGLDSPVRSGRWHAQTERQLEDSGLPFTHLRPLFFMQNILRFAPTIRASGVFVGALDQGKVAMIDVADIAAVAATILTTPGHTGKAYTLTGAEALSYADVAGKLSGHLRRPVIYRNVTSAAMRAALLASGMPDWHVDIQVEFSLALGSGQASTVTNAVEAITGKAPRTLDQFISEHLALFNG